MKFCKGTSTNYEKERQPHFCGCRSCSQYISLILSALHDADLSKYKDSMRPLIEKDMVETEKALTE